VPNPDDEQFENFLKQFCPLDPDPLPTEWQPRRTRRWFVLAAWAATAAVVLVSVALTMCPRPEPAQLTHTSDTDVGTQQSVNPQPLTRRTANALLAQSPSIKATLDRIAFQPQSVQIPKGKHSIFAVLGKEKKL
jgi:hypothetical protein